MLKIMSSIFMSFLMITNWGELMIFNILLMFLINTMNSDFLIYLDISMSLELDLLSFILIILSTWITILCLMASMSIKNKNKNIMFLFLFLILLFSLVLTFLSNSFLLFYIMFEVSLLPIFFLILGYGYQPERVQAGIYMFFYTLLGSLPLFIFILFMFYKSGSSYMFMFFNMKNYLNFMNSMFMLSAFLMKFPMYMVHLWLLKAHVEAPVSGSMMLAGVMLKLGGYGMMRFFIFFDILNFYLIELIISLSVWGALYVSFNCLRQNNMKLLVASSSVVHMGLCLVGLFVLNNWGLIGFIYLMISHGLCSSGLFYLVNVVYERTQSQNMMISKGLMNLLPILTLYWFLLLMGNMAAPPTINLLSELILIISLISWKKSMFILLGILSFFSASYNFYLFSLTQHGKFILNKTTLNPINMNEMLVCLLHWIPLNLLILVSYYMY